MVDQETADGGVRKFVGVTEERWHQLVEDCGDVFPRPLERPLNPVNPVTLVRDRLGLSRADVARLTGCGYGMLTRAENGYDPALPPSVAQALALLGLPEEDARRMYAEWREWRARALRNERVVKEPAE